MSETKTYATQIMSVQEFIKAAWAKVIKNKAINGEVEDFMGIRTTARVLASMILRESLMECPFCGSTKDTGVTIDGEGGLYHYISCEQCKGRGRSIDEGNDYVNMELEASAKLMDERFALDNDEWEEMSANLPKREVNILMNRFTTMRTLVSIYYAARFWNTRRLTV